MNQDEIADRLAPLFGRVLQDELEGVVVLNDDGTNPAESFLYTIPVRVENQSETTYVRYDPLADATAFSDGSPVKLHYNEDGELEARFDARRGRQAYGGVIPTRNMLFMQHTHESPSTGGQLNASLVFDDGTVPVARGGTNIGSYAVGDIIYASGATTLSKLAGVATGNALISGGVNTAPAWGKISLTTHVSGTLPVGNGGTGAATLTANNVILGNGTSAVQFVAPGTSGNVLTSNGTTWTSAAPSGGSPFTHSGGLIYPTTTTDNMTLGGSTNIAKLGIIGDTDEPQLIVRFNATQTANGVDIQNSTPNSLFKITSTAAIFNDDSLDRDFIVEGNGDALLFNTEGTSDRVGIGKVPALAKLDILGTADEPVLTLRPIALQSASIFTILNGSGATLMGVDPLGTLSFDGGAIFNDSGNTGASFRVESDLRTHMLYVLANDNAVGINNSTPTAMLDIGASLSGQASFRMHAGTAPSAPNEGDEWNDSTLKSKAARLSGINQYYIGRLFTATANAGPSNTNAETTIVGSGIGTTTLPAAFFTAGKVIKVRVMGMYSTDGTSRDIQIRVKLGGTTVGDATLTSTAASANGGRTFKIEYDIRCVATGVSGTVQGQGYAFGQNVQQGFNTNGTSPADTTGTLPIDVTADFVTSNANCHFTSNVLYFEAEN